jgi:hypothetical protein
MMNGEKANSPAYLEPRCRAGEHDIAGDDEPEGVIADELDVDEDADDPKNNQRERDDKSPAHLQPPGAWSGTSTGR